MLLRPKNGSTYICLTLLSIKISKIAMENGSKEWLAAQINQARTELTQLRIQLGIDPNDSIPGLESSQPNKNTDTRPITATSSQDKGK